LPSLDGSKNRFRRRGKHKVRDLGYGFRHDRARGSKGSTSCEADFGALSEADADVNSGGCVGGRPGRTRSRCRGLSRAAHVSIPERPGPFRPA